MSRLFLFVFFIFFASFAYANANSSVTTGYNRSDIFNKIKRAIKSPKVPGSPNIPSALIGLGVTGLIDGIEKIQKDMENPNFIDEKAKEHISHTDTQTTHGGASGGGGVGYDYIYSGVAYSSPEQVRALMLQQIDKNGWKLSRQSDGYYYQHWVVNMQNKTMRLYAHVAQKNDPACARLNNRCGWHTDFTGYIVPIGDINKKTFYNTKEKARDIALDKVINDLIDKHEEELKTAIPTGVGTGVGADTGVGTGVGADTGSQEATDEATQVQPRPIPTDTPKPFEVPKFCTWASSVCSFIDWVKQEPPQIEKTKVGEIKDDIDWRQYAERKWLNFGNAQCPQDVRIPVQWMNVKQDLVISYVPFCKFATMIKPAVILGAYISALMIISVGRQRE